jgi:quinol monooxygenase YgiN
MIYQCSKELDREDVAVLFAAMVQVAEVHGETLDRSLVTIGYGEGLQRCEYAAKVLAELQGDDVQDDDWDGCVWFEMLESYEPKSLAYRLFTLEETWEDRDAGAAWFAAVNGVVQAWIAADPDDE